MGGGTGVEAAQPALRLTVGERETVLFSHRREACEPWDIPDTPTRAFRDASGTIHVFQSHHRARASVGDSFETLEHRCRISYRGGERDDPASFDNRSWIASTFTSDGRTVHAVLHDEYHGRDGARCDRANADACWYNALTAAVSRDGGDTFAAAEPRLVAALPRRAEATEGRRAGFFEPTNIVPVTGGFAMMANVVAPEPQRSGNCLLRTDNLADASRWRAWHDGAYRTRFADPYAEEAEPTEHVCDPIAPEALPWPVTSLVRHEGSGRWIATMKGRRVGADGRERTGVFISTSPDLLHWEGPALVFEAPLMGSGHSCAPDQPIGYPALIDPASPDRNFATVGDHPVLTFVRTRLEGCEIGPDRDVAMRPVRIERMN